MAPLSLNLAPPAGLVDGYVHLYAQISSETTFCCAPNVEVVITIHCLAREVDNFSLATLSQYEELERSEDAVHW